MSNWQKSRRLGAAFVLGIFATAAWAQDPVSGLRKVANPETIAQNSVVVQRNWTYLNHQVQAIDEPFRSATLELMERPYPSFIPTNPREFENWRRDAMDRLSQHRLEFRGRDGEGATVQPEDVFPVIDFDKIVFFAPGGAYGRRHGYPGGLVVHTASNVRMAWSYYENYCTTSGISLNDDLVRWNYVLAAQILHDLFKVYVFDWNSDGTTNREPLISGVRLHGVLILAEVIHRRFPVDFVLTLAASHSGPDSDGRQEMMDQIRAACAILDEDPFELGFFEVDEGEVGLTEYPPLEAFFTYLANEDSILASESIKRVGKELAKVFQKNEELRNGPCGLEEFANRMFAFHTPVKLYAVFARFGREALTRLARESACWQP